MICLPVKEEAIGDKFFAALERVREIHANCRALLRTHHQRAGLELMDAMAAHQEAAYERLCRSGRNSRRTICKSFTCAMHCHQLCTEWCAVVEHGCFQSPDKECTASLSSRGAAWASRWVQAECRELGDQDAPEVEALLQRGARALRQRSVLFRYCAEEVQSTSHCYVHSAYAQNTRAAVCAIELAVGSAPTHSDAEQSVASPRCRFGQVATARHGALFQRFISALTRAGPGGMPRPIEMHAHDPRRYIGCVRQMSCQLPCERLRKIQLWNPVQQCSLLFRATTSVR